MIRLQDFLDNPGQATYDGYQPCYLDCLCWVASWFGADSIKKMISETKNLFTKCSVVRFPFELLKVIVFWILLISIPFGMFFILGIHSWFFCWQPKVLEPRVKQQRELMRGDYEY